MSKDALQELDEFIKLGIPPEFLKKFFDAFFEMMKIVDDQEAGQYILDFEDNLTADERIHYSKLMNWGKDYSFDKLLTKALPNKNLN